MGSQSLLDCRTNDTLRMNKISFLLQSLRIQFVFLFASLLNVISLEYKMCGQIPLQTIEDHFQRGKLKKYKKCAHKMNAQAQDVKMLYVYLGLHFHLLQCRST